MIDLQTRHFFSDGICIKRMEIPAGHFCISHKHKYDHMSILSEGSALVTVDDKSTKYYPGDCIFIEKGKHHRVDAIDDITWFCIHATDETDETKVDEVLICR